MNSSRDEYILGNTYGPSPMLRTQDSLDNTSPSRPKSTLNSQVNLRSQALANNFVASCEKNGGLTGRKSAISASRVNLNTSCFQEKKVSAVISKSPISNNVGHRMNTYRSNSNVKSASSHISALSASKRDLVVMMPLTEEVIRKEMLNSFQNIKLDCYNDLLRIKKP